DMGELVVGQEAAMALDAETFGEPRDDGRAVAGKQSYMVAVRQHIVSTFHSMGAHVVLKNEGGETFAVPGEDGAGLRFGVRARPACTPQAIAAAAKPRLDAQPRIFGDVLPVDVAAGAEGAGDGHRIGMARTGGEAGGEGM